MRSSCAVAVIQICSVVTCRRTRSYLKTFFVLESEDDWTEDLSQKAATGTDYRSNNEFDRKFKSEVTGQKTEGAQAGIQISPPHPLVLTAIKIKHENVGVADDNSRGMIQL
jgi:hypothetical protein